MHEANAIPLASRTTVAARPWVNDTLKLVPLLVFYVLLILVVVVGFSPPLAADEQAYLWYAGHLSNGYYSPLDSIRLWHGPGYPMILLPFVLLDLPLLVPKLLNALILFAAAIYLYRTLRFYVPDRLALVFAYLLGLWPPLLRYAHMLFTEPTAVLLVCAFMFHFCRLLRDGRARKSDILLASFYLAYLAMVKIFFGYVILAALISFAALYLWKRSQSLKNTSLVFAAALLLCVPYLYYTYSLTGKVFYWGNSGGPQLYWMSSPYETDLGDWQADHWLDTNPELYKNHHEFFAYLDTLSSIDRDEAIRRQAVDNIIHHPAKYFTNWLANLGRLLFNYPYSYMPQKLNTFLYLVPNMFLVVVSALCIYPAYLGRSQIQFEVRAMGWFGLIAFGGSSLLSAYSRQLLPIDPIIVLWVAFVVANLLTIEIHLEPGRVQKLV